MGVFSAGYIETARTSDDYICATIYFKLISSVFSALRVFAVWQQSYVWASAVLILGIAPAATNLVWEAFGYVLRYAYSTSSI